MKILITSYYGLRDSLLGAANGLRKLGYNIIDYPLMEKINCKSDYIDDLINYINYENPDIILWWYMLISSNEFKKIVKNGYKKQSSIFSGSLQSIKNIYFNWDDPFNYQINDICNKAKYLDIVFISCKEKDKYIKDGSKNVICLYPGFDAHIHHPLLEDDNLMSKYECDISICCTNLYEADIYQYQYIQRKNMIDTIYNNMKKYNYKFYIYGPDSFKDIYPDAYRGIAQYNETNLIFNYSKINICTHVLCDRDGYLNERVILILASGGLLFVDPVKGIEKELKHMNNCFIFNKDIYLDQIINIISNYDNYWIIRHNAFIASKKFEWNKWASIVDNEIKLI